MSTRTIDLTPTWAEILPAILMLMDSPKTRKTAEAELRRMAEAADNWNAHCKEVKA